MLLIVNFCFDLIMILVFVNYEVEVMENETYTQVVFFYDKFVCDDEVDFHKKIQVINIYHKLCIYQ